MNEVDKNRIIRNKEELRQFVIALINDDFAWLDGEDLAKYVNNILDAVNYDCDGACVQCPFRNKLEDGSTERCNLDCVDTMTVNLSEAD